MKGKNANMILKIDLEKAFDRLKWPFIRDTLIFFNFLDNKLILSCISTSSISILINGSSTDIFSPSREIRQGDPMSPYIFILCMERISRSIDWQVSRANWFPIKIGRSGPKLSHLFFADDLTLMTRANTKNCHTILNTLVDFNQSSGQNINFAKSKVIFSSNCKSDVISNLSSILSIQHNDNFGKYLGFPIFLKRPTHSDFQFIIDNLNFKLAGWKTNFLNIAGRTSLAKASLCSIANHVMQYISLPRKITNQINRLQRNFVWGTTNTKKKLHLVSWDTITKHKYKGGLGMHKAEVKNSAMHASLAWRLFKNHKTPWANVLISKYYTPKR